MYNKIDVVSDNAGDSKLNNTGASALYLENQSSWLVR